MTPPLTQARELKAQGMPQKAVALQLGVSESTVSRYLKVRT
jgi:predicted transcriptional regulator